MMMMMVPAQRKKSKSYGLRPEHQEMFHAIARQADVNDSRMMTAVILYLDGNPKIKAQLVKYAIENKDALR
jgi:hypothetical protein